MAILYFTAAVDNDWYTLGNWWTDESCTIQSMSLPSSTDDVVLWDSIYFSTATVANLTIMSGYLGFSTITVTGVATFYNSSGGDGGIIYGNCIFNDNSFSGGLFIDGDATLYDYSAFNAGSDVTGSCVFYDISRMDGNFTGDPIFNDNSRFGYGTITGNPIFNDTSDHGDGIGGTTIGNVTFNNNSFNSGFINGNAIFNNGSSNIIAGTITGDCTFNGSSYNSGTITGDCTFNGGSYNDGSYGAGSGAITGNCTFNDSSNNSGTITGDCTFNDSSINQYIINGNCVFNDDSYNNLNCDINGNCTFNNNSYNYGSITGNCIFNDSSHNSSSSSNDDYITGSCTFNDSSYNEGAISNQTCIFNDNSKNQTYGQITTDICTFNDNSYNEGTVTTSSYCIFYGGYNSGEITGSCVFMNNSFNSLSGNPNAKVTGDCVFNNSSFNQSVVNGNCTFNDSALNYGPYNNGYTGTVNGNATFSASSFTGSYEYNIGNVGDTVTFSSSSPVNFSIAENWTKDASSWIFSTPGNSWTFTGSGCNSSALVGSCSFYNNSSNQGSVTGACYFYDNSSNNNSLDANCTFYDSSTNYGSISSPYNCTFYNYSVNEQYIYNGQFFDYSVNNHYLAYSDFWDNSTNYGSINGATFWNNSSNYGSLSQSSSFNDYSQNNGSCDASDSNYTFNNFAVNNGNIQSLNTTFNNNSYNSSTGIVNSAAYPQQSTNFNNESFNNGTVSGIIYYNGFTGYIAPTYYVGGEVTTLNSCGSGVHYNYNNEYIPYIEGVQKQFSYDTPDGAWSPCANAYLLPDVWAISVRTTNLNQNGTGYDSWGTGTPTYFIEGSVTTLNEFGTGCWNNTYYENGVEAAPFVGSGFDSDCTQQYWIDGQATELDVYGNGFWNNHAYYNGNLQPTGYNGYYYYINDQQTSLDQTGTGCWNENFYYNESLGQHSPTFSGFESCDSKYYINGAQTTLDQNGSGCWNGNNYYNGSFGLAPGIFYPYVGFTSASLLLHFDGSNNDTTTTDSSINNYSVSFVGNAKISNNQSKFGGSSLDLTNGGHITILNSSNIIPSTSDFTIEAWVYITGSPSYNYSQLFGAAGSIIIGIEATGGLFIEHAGVGGLGYTAGSVPLAVWSHVAVSRKGDNFNLFVDGNLVGTTTSSRTFLPTENYTIGLWGSDARNFPGYIEDFRIIKGLAIYTAPFTPPSSSLLGAVPNKPIADLLLHFDGEEGSSTFTDSSDNQLSIANTSALISTTQSKFGGSCGSFSGGYIQVENDWGSLNSNDYTIEFWIWPITQTQDDRILCFENQSGESRGLIYNSGNIEWNYFGTSSVLSAAYPLAQTWSHIAIVNNNGTKNLYINGMLLSTTTSDLIPNSSNLMLIGASITNYVLVQLDSFIDDFRIINGLALYTGSFTPPTYRTGFSTCDSSYYVEGQPSTLSINGNGYWNDIYYVGGIQTTLNANGTGGWYGSYYINGVQTPLDQNGNGIWNGIYYTNGEPHVATTLYFNGAVSNEWTDLGNWWTDESFQNQSTYLPSPVDSVIASASISSNSGSNPTINNITLNGSSGLDITITITGDCVLNDYSSLSGNITGNCTFNDYANNDGNGIVNGNCTFNDSSNNAYDGSIVGNCTFNNNSLNDGNITGDCTFNSSSHNNGTITGNCTFNDGSINYGSINGDCTFNGGSINYGGPINGFCTFNEYTYNRGTINGDAIFNNSSYNSSNGGIVNGNATFNDSSSNNVDGTGTIQGVATYTQTEIYKYNIGYTEYYGGGISLPNATVFYIINEVLDFSPQNFTGQFVFSSTAQNNANITGNCSFNDGSYNSATILGDCTLNNYSYNIGTITGNCIFNDLAVNGNFYYLGSGVINGNVTFNSQGNFNLGTINGNLTTTVSYYDLDYINSFGYGWMLGDYTVTGTITFSSATPVQFVTNSVYIDDYRSGGWIFSTPGQNWEINGNAFVTSMGVLNGDAAFSDNSYNLGTVTGNATFNDSSIHGLAGIINGNATFNDSSIKRGGVSGNLTFNSSYHPDGDGLTYYFNANVDNSWTTLGNWWLDNSIPVTEIIGIPLISGLDSVVINANLTSNTQPSGAASVKNLTVNDAYHTIDFYINTSATYNGSAALGQMYGSTWIELTNNNATATFNNNSICYAGINIFGNNGNGSVTFNDNSYAHIGSYIKSNITFTNYYFTKEPIGTVIGTISFTYQNTITFDFASWGSNDYWSSDMTTWNFASTTTNNIPNVVMYFYNNQFNDGTIKGINITFNNNSYNNGTISSYSTETASTDINNYGVRFINTDYQTGNYGTINGDVHFGAEGYAGGNNYGTINGNCRFSNGGCTNYGDIIGDVILEDNTTNDTNGTILGNCIIRGFNAGTITTPENGSVDFYRLSGGINSETAPDGTSQLSGYGYNRGTINGNANFYDASRNGLESSDPNQSGTINGVATFNDNSYNVSGYITTAKFYENSYNYGSLTGSAEFHDSIIHNGTIVGDATFKDSSTNNGTVTGVATFAGIKFNNGAGTVGSTVYTPTSPTTIYVSTSGSDYNDGSESNPLATAQRAFEMAYYWSESENRTIIFGSGSFVGVDLNSAGGVDWPFAISVQGTGATQSYLGGIIGYGADEILDYNTMQTISAPQPGLNISINSNKTINLGDISVFGGSIDYMGLGSSSEGGDSGNVNLINAIAQNINSNGGSGWDHGGSAGDISLSETICSSITANGGNSLFGLGGGDSAQITLLNSTCGDINSNGGANNGDIGIYPAGPGLAGNITLTNSTSGNISCVGGGCASNYAGPEFGSNGGIVNLVSSSCGTINVSGGTIDNPYEYPFSGSFELGDGGDVTLEDSTSGNITAGGGTAIGLENGENGTVNLVGYSVIPNQIYGALVLSNNLNKGRGINGSSILGIV